MASRFYRPYQRLSSEEALGRQAAKLRALRDPAEPGSRRSAADRLCMPEKQKGPTKRAKILSETEFTRFRQFVMDQHFHPLAADVVIQLSFRAGLRASEIAKFTLDSILTPAGRVDTTMIVYGATTKNRKSRYIPVHGELSRSVASFMKAYPGVDFVAFSQQRQVRPVTPNALTVWFWRQFKKCGFKGCSSHSGRRTFITQLAHIVGQHGSSLRDVQLAAGHARLDTTEKYIEPSKNFFKAIAALGMVDPQDPDDDSPEGSDGSLT
ncbi:site-specific integrase [Sphingomonas sp. SRS2]|uniref:site-specific integrase n=1 Tax=Sphingomonas sp. SRS2 TaxID=133190 RepID=UPI0006968DCF|nr:site-specific integrase [Sphingomonas sp. SRS2]